MACEIISCEAAVFALWGRPTFADVDGVLSAIRSGAKLSGRPVVYIARVPLEAPPPESDVRQRLNEAMPDIRADCASFHIILEGDGFISSVKRAILASMMQFGWQRDTFFIHASAGQVSFKAPREYRDTVERILYMAEQQGLLSASAPGEQYPSTIARASRA